MKKTEDNLNKDRECDEIMKLVFKKLPVAILIVDKEGNINFANQQAERLFGYTIEELSTFKVEQLIPVRFRTKHVGYRNSFFNDPGPRFLGNGRSLWGLTKEGKEIPIEIGLDSVITEDGQCALVSIIDIAKRKKKEEEVKKLSNAIQQTSDAILITNISGVIEFVNSAFEKITGYSKEEAIGKTPRILKSGKYDNQFYKKMWDTILSGSEFKADLVNKRKNGEIYYQELSIVPLRDDNGTVTHFISSSRDVTERKKIEEQVRGLVERLKRSNAELEQFAYVASHDLQEPLRMVTGYLQLLEKKLKDKLGQDEKEFIDFAVDGANRMSRLINDLLEFSRVESKGKQFSKVDCNDVVKVALKNLEKRIRETGANIKSDNLPVLNGDSNQLIQLLQNLIGNAIKYSKKGSNPEINISVKKDDRKWIFSVKDNGIGIPKGQEERIFQIFQRLHARDEYDGTGIGLAVCKRIVECHNGKIWVESEEKKGSTFYFTIPETR